MSLLEELKRELDGIDVSIEERTDFSGYGVSPLAVVFAESEDHVVRTLIFANRKGLKVVPWGGGTSVTGALKCEGCVLLDLSRMRKIVEINDVDWYVRVQPGVVLDELNRELERRGFFLPPDPSSSFMCTVGGAIVENAGGMRAFKYGPFREWVLALRLALADGTVIKVGEPLRKNRAGYDLVSLVVGSEGTLGVVTEAWLRIRPLPKHEEVTLAIYPKDIFAVGEIVKVVRKSGLEPDLMEYMDAFVVRSVNKQIEPIYWEGEGGVVLVRGDNSTLSEVERLSSPFLARSEVVDGEVGRKMLNGRSLVAIAVKSEIGNIYAEDIVVPPSKLSEAILQIKRIEVENDTKIPVAGHVGDGNLHPMLREADLVSKPELFDEVGGVALRLGGSISGEHGIGIQKVNLLRSQLLNRNGEVVVKLMKEIKGLFDPKDTLNQGKFVDPL